MTTPAERPLSAMIVDDEPPARRTLELLLARERDITVVAACGDGPSAIRALRQHTPDLVFLDIQIPGADGFDVLRDLEPERRPLVAFVTAFDEYAVRAFEAHAVDYLLKPFTDERLAATVDRMRAAVRLRRVDEIERRFQALVDATAAAAYGPGGPLVVRDGRRTLVLPTSDIEWIEAEDYYVRIHAGATHPLVRRSLQSLTIELEPLGFARVHRSALVNLAHVREIRPLSSGDAEIRLSSGATVRLSRTLRDAVAARAPFTRRG